MCVWFFLVFGKVGQMTIIGEGMGIQNGMGLLCRSATDTLETFLGSVYQPNMTLLTFFNAVKPDNTYIQAASILSEGHQKLFKVGEGVIWSR